MCACVCMGPNEHAPVSACVEGEVCVCVCVCVCMWVWVYGCVHAMCFIECSPAVLNVIKPAPLVGDRHELVKLPRVSESKVGRVVHDWTPPPLFHRIKKELSNDGVGVVLLHIVETVASINLRSKLYMCALYDMFARMQQMYNHMYS